MQDQSLFELRRRTFDTPHFRGIEFIEAEAKTIINKVPGNYLPFKWTINPYRGCSHACTFCQTGDTRILMADGRTKPLAEIRVGDEIYGTQRVGNYRRFVTTPVLDHWHTTKAAFRVTLEDGTTLIASGDHRYLSNRGWKYVTGSYGGFLQRPHLTVNNHLLGTGRFADPPVHDDDYKQGYLCGMVRGDAHIRSGPSISRSGREYKQESFRLALVDFEAIKRSRTFLADIDVATTQFVFQAAVGGRKELRAIRTFGRSGVQRIVQTIAWPNDPSPSWRKGFLAGIFDAEGGYSRGIFRISNTDHEIIDQITAGMDAFNFSYVIEDPGRSNGIKVVRLLGGVCEALRFFQTVDTAITRKRSIEGQAIKNKAKLRVTAIDFVGLDVPMYDITTGTGDFIANGVVSHNCFARSTHTYLDMNAGRDFETKIVVKVNAPDLLKRELAAKRWKGEHIAMGTATDPYQRAEGRYKLMPGIIRTLTEFRNPFSILTKGTLILRDLPLLEQAAEVADVATAFSVPTLSDEVWRRSEPGTPHPRKRIEAVAKLNAKGIPCGVMLAPIQPGISDDPKQLMDVVRAAVDAGATHVSPILLHLRPVVREEYMAWLRDAYPDLVTTYEEMYAAGAYGPKEMRKDLGRRVSGLVRAAGGLRPTPSVTERWAKQAKPELPKQEAKQLELL